MFLDELLPLLQDLLVCALCSLYPCGEVWVARQADERRGVDVWCERTLEEQKGANEHEEDEEDVAGVSLEDVRHHELGPRRVWSLPCRRRGERRGRRCSQLFAGADAARGKADDDVKHSK